MTNKKNFFEPTIHVSIKGNERLDLVAHAITPNNSFRAGKVCTGKPDGLQFDLQGVFFIQLMIRNSGKIDSPVKLFENPVQWSELNIELPKNTKQIFVLVLLNNSTILNSQVIYLEEDSISLEDAQKFSALESSTEALSRAGLGDIRLLKKSKDRPH